MIERFAALFGGLNGDRQVFLQLRLTGEVGETFWPKRRLELALFFARRSRNDALLTHEAPVYRTGCRSDAWIRSPAREGENAVLRSRAGVHRSGSPTRAVSHLRALHAADPVQRFHHGRARSSN